MYPLFKYLYHQCLDRPDRWYPFLSVYYLTYGCDFRCPYCSNGFNKPYHELSPEILPGKKVLDILKRIRAHCDYLVITGGEPLLHPDFAEVMEHLPKLRFKHVALNTNGFALDRFLPQITGSVHTLIISLDTLDPQKGDAWYGRGPGVFNKIRANIELAAQYTSRNHRIMISSVVFLENIADLYEVYAYTQRMGFTLAASPVLMGVKAPAALMANQEYRTFFEFLISEKRKGAAVHGSPLYLSYMRDFKKFQCHPFTMLVVDPLGNIFYPCLELNQTAGNILASHDLHLHRRQAHIKFGPQPQCDTGCHSACALGFSLLLEHPGSLFQEAVYAAKNYWLRYGKQSKTSRPGGLKME